MGHEGVHQLIRTEDGDHILVAHLGHDQLVGEAAHPLALHDVVPQLLCQLGGVAGGVVGSGGEGVGVHHVDKGRGLVHLSGFRQAQLAVRQRTVLQVEDAGSVLTGVGLGEIAAGNGKLLVLAVGVPYRLQYVQGAGGPYGVAVTGIVLAAAGGQTQHQQGCQHKGYDLFHGNVLQNFECPAQGKKRGCG